MEFTCLLIALLVQSMVCVTRGTTLIADFNMRGVKGTVTFVQNAKDGDTTVTYNLHGLDSQKQWVIHEKRTIYDTNVKCLQTTIGNQLGSAGGTVPASGSGTMTVAGSVIADLTSIIGSSLVLSGSTCATIEKAGKHITAFARLPTEIAGIVTFRQANGSTEVTTIITDVFQVTKTTSVSIKSLNWKIHSGTVQSDSIHGNPTMAAHRCSNIGAIYNPTNPSGTCDENNQGNCPVGDLSQKHGKVPVAVSQGDLIKGYRDRNLPLSGGNSIIGKTLAIYDDNNKVISCANIIKYHARSASVELSMDGVKTHINFKQDSPYDKTVVNVDIEGLREKASGYHIHEWPVPYKMTKKDDMCSNAFVSGHFNPYNVVPTWPPAGTGTTDQYEIGDLSNKYGLLDNKTRMDSTFFDRNLPMFGINSIIGRSLVIHKVDGSRWVCGNILNERHVPMTIAAVTFVYPVIGWIEFRQPKNSWYDDTQVFVELNYNDGTNNPTTGHKWHIHANRTGSDILASKGDRCISAAGHYNPYEVDLGGNYDITCKPESPLRCELGDLSGKHGKIGVRTSFGGMKRAFFTDINLPLSGPQSLLKRSLVIHYADGTRLACGDIYEIPERIAKIDQWQKMTSASVTGSIALNSATPGFMSGKTGVKIDVQNLAREASGFHVHEYPLPDNNIAPCSTSAVGGHYNPFEVAGGPAPGNGSDDQYEIGDMSGKYGDPMKDNTAISKFYYDTNLPLRGPNSIVGRSVVIHKTSGARWVCGNISEDTVKSKGNLYEAVANFNAGELRGQIFLRQYLYPDGGMSDTGILVNLAYADKSKPITLNHTWHVHENPVTTDYTTGCVSPGSHFNPFKVDMGVTYNSECSFSNPLRCELGDQAGKVGTYDVGGGKRFYTDIYLPLTGKYGVVGTRSFVVHSPNKLGARIACANIMPLNGVSTEMSFPVGSKTFDRFHMAQTLAKSMHADTFNIVTEKMSETSKCITAKVYFLGNSRNTLKSSMEKHMRDDDDSMGIYAQKDCRQTSKGVSVSISISTMLTFLVLQKIVKL